MCVGGHHICKHSQHPSEANRDMTQPLNTLKITPPPMSVCPFTDTSTHLSYHPLPTLTYHSGPLSLSSSLPRRSPLSPQILLTCPLRTFTHCSFFLPQQLLASPLPFLFPSHNTNTHIWSHMRAAEAPSPAVCFVSTEVLSQCY